MKTYRVTVNGHVYEVTVEEVTGLTPGDFLPQVTTPTSTTAPTLSVQSPRMKMAPKPASPPPPAPASKPAPVASPSKGVQAPMPGKILAVKVVPGDRVKAGTALVILEAMKMENDIMAPVDATIKSVNVSVGDSVNTGDILIEFE